MKKIFLGALLSLNIFGTTFALSSLNLIDEQLITTNNCKQKKSSNKKSDTQENKIYFMNEQEETEGFRITDLKYQDYWNPAREVSTNSDGDHNYGDSSDLFVIKNIDYSDVKYKINLYWGHKFYFTWTKTSQLAREYNGTFYVNLYHENSLVSQQFINIHWENIELVHYEHFGYGASLEATLLIDDDQEVDKIDFSYLLKGKDYSNDSFAEIQASSIGNYYLQFADYFAFDVSQLDLIKYNDVNDLIDFSLAIDFKNGQLFIPEKSRVDIEIDGIKFEANINEPKSKKDAHTLFYEAEIPEQFLSDFNQVQVVVDDAGVNDITNRVLGFLNNSKSSNVIIIISSIVSVLILLLLLILLLIMILKRRTKVVENNNYYEYKTYVDSKGRYVDFSQDEWNKLSAEQQKIYSEVPETELLDGYYEFHSNSEEFTLER